MESDRLAEVQELVAGAASGDPDQLSLPLTRDRFADLGVALDESTRLLQLRGYHLARVRGEESGWVAIYNRVAH